MPIFRINKDLHYFAHVPKCGGTSVEFYLTERFGRLGFHEPGRHLIPEAQVWNQSSGEHIPVAALDRLIPQDWFASSFAIVRHPLRRLISAFFFARDVTGHLALQTDVNTWFAGVAQSIADKPFDYGSHIAPQSGFVPNGSTIFRLEDGLDRIVPYLDGLAGTADGPRTVSALNVGKWRNEEPPPVPSDATLQLLNRVYAVDFARFGYPPLETSGTASALPDLPVLSATGRPPVAGRRTFAQRLVRTLQKKIERK